MKTRPFDAWGSLPPTLGLATLLVIAAPVLTVKAVGGPIVGRVFDTSLGVDVGIHFALVELHIPGASGGVTSATTAADGSFAINLPPGDDAYVFVSVSAQGFYPFNQWSSGPELRQASPLAIGLEPAPQRVETTIAGVVYDAAVGPTAPIAGADVHYAYHSYREAFPDAAGTLHTAADGRYDFDQSLGAGDWIEFSIAAPGFATFTTILGASNLLGGAPRDFGLAPTGGLVRIEPAEVHIDCPGSFTVTITNVGAEGETLVILAIDLHFHYGEGVYGTAFTADLSQVRFPVLLARGEQLGFPMTFTGAGTPGGTFPSLLTLTVIGGGRAGPVSAPYYGGFHSCSTRCPGDCNGDGSVTVDELVHGVDIALGQRDVSACAPLDANADGVVSITEIIVAVERAFTGCGS